MVKFCLVWLGWLGLGVVFPHFLKLLCSLQLLRELNVSYPLVLVDGTEVTYSEILCSFTMTIFQGHRDDQWGFQECFPVNNVKILSLYL